MHDELEGFRGARRDEYRVVLQIDEEQRVIRVDHRSDIYRPNVTDKKQGRLGARALLTVLAEWLSCSPTAS